MEIERLRKENEQLRKDLLFQQLLNNDAIEKVFQCFSANQLQEEFNETFNFSDFTKEYHQYIKTYHKKEEYPEFDANDWEKFWINYNELYHTQTQTQTQTYNVEPFAHTINWKDIFKQQRKPCRWCKSTKRECEEWCYTELTELTDL